MNIEHDEIFWILSKDVQEIVQGPVNKENIYFTNYKIVWIIIASTIFSIFKAVEYIKSTFYSIKTVKINLRVPLEQFKR